MPEVRRAAGNYFRVSEDLSAPLHSHPRTPFLNDFRLADKPLVSPLPKEIAAFLLDCR